MNTNNKNNTGIATNNHTGMLDSLRKLKEKTNQNKSQTSNYTEQKTQNTQSSFITDVDKNTQKNTAIVELLTEKEQKMKGNQIARLVDLFQKNKIIQSKTTVNFVAQMFGELPANLVDDIYNMYHESMLVQLKYKQK